jgi:hypothetical protein
VRDQEARCKIQELEVEIKLLKDSIGTCKVRYPKGGYFPFPQPPPPVAKVADKVYDRLEALLDHLGLEIEFERSPGLVVKKKTVDKGGK